MRQLMTADEVAVQLNLIYRDGPKKGQPNVRYVWKMAREGRLPTVSLPNSRLIRFDPLVIEQLFFQPNNRASERKKSYRPAAVRRSLKTEEKSEKKAVVSANNRKDLLCL